MEPRKEHVLAGFARQQLGVATRAQLIDVDLTTNQIDYLLRTGRLERVFNSVYRVAGVEESYLQMLLASCWAGGDRGAIASHRAAAWLWGLPGGEQLVEITSLRWRRTRNDAIVVHEMNRTNTIDMTVHDGLIPVTRPARTILDLCGLAERRVIGEDVVEAALQDAVRRDLVDIALIGQRYERLGGDRRLGGKVAARLIDRWVPAVGRTANRAETALLEMLLAHGLPEPLPQYPVWLGPNDCVKLDFAWPDRKVGLEFDSYRWHGGRIKHDLDAQRTLRVEGRGWHMLRVTDAELDAGCPDLLRTLDIRVRGAA